MLRAKEGRRKEKLLGKGLLYIPKSSEALIAIKALTNPY